jgi:riboflavin synthase alpha subunit
MLSPAGLRLAIDPAGWSGGKHKPSPGDSICVSGVCLTLAEPPVAGDFIFNAVPETLAKTTLADLRPGSMVNLEPALRAGDPLGGHFVQGHVDGVAAVAGLHTRGEHRVTLRPPPDLMPFVTPRGSVCLDGVSLTIARVDPAGGTFDVALIPTTLDLTTLGSLREGSRVNLEADVLARTMVHWLRHYTDHRV